MKLTTKLIIFSLIIMLNGCFRKEVSVIDENRITTIEVKHHTFDGREKTTEVKVLDVLAKNTQKIFAELYKNNFPIYDICGYGTRLTTSGEKPSLHAYGGAIDINPYINPYLDVPKGSRSITPKRFTNRKKDARKILEYLISKNVETIVVDRSEAEAILKNIVQKLGSDDWFINRELLRKGMLTKKEAKTFKKYGFTIWGGAWRQPMDFMHFQIPRTLAERLAKASKEEGKIIFADHLKSIRHP